MSQRTHPPTRQLPALPRHYPDGTGLLDANATDDWLLPISLESLRLGAGQHTHHLKCAQEGDRRRRGRCRYEPFSTMAAIVAPGQDSAHPDGTVPGALFIDAYPQRLLASRELGSVV
ncbi:hypothetical protein RB213_008258 [Colletotrichum asianum]